MQSETAIVAPEVVQQTAEFRDRFVMATPFPHLAIDGFFEPQFARELLEQFPAFEGRYAIDEMGGVGRKAVIPSIAALGPAFRRAHEYFGSRAFLDWMSELTGIPGLQYDAENFGGGTHESLDGQDLLPHVDFNYHPRTGMHRRLNLIVYLNEGWQPEWGGSLVIHSNPRDPAQDRTKSFVPVFNRCVLFETSERSWHSFDRVSLPPGEKQRSRKSLSIYLYTRERPDAETFADHTTFYVPRPLPPQFHVGHTLTQEDVLELERYLKSRDDLLALHQDREAQREPATEEVAKLRIRLAEWARMARLPLQGYVRQTGALTGWYPDGWTGETLEFTVEAQRSVRGFTISGGLPERAPAGTTVTVELNGQRVASVSPPRGGLTLRVAAPIRRGAEATIRVGTSSTVNLKALGAGGDERDLGIHLDAIVFEHD